MVKNLPAVQETGIRSLGWEDRLEEEERATHSNILPWRIAWTEETGGLQSIKWGLSSVNRVHGSGASGLLSCLHIQLRVSKYVTALLSGRQDSRTSPYRLSRAPTHDIHTSGHAARSASETPFQGSGAWEVSMLGC